MDWSFAFEIAVTEARAPGGGDPAAWASVTNRESEAPPWELDQGVGDCGFYDVRPQQSCDPDCDPGAWCTWDGECVTATRPIDAGGITVEGLGVALALEPSGEWVYYGYDFEPEPGDGEIFGEGDAITATAVGGTIAPFALWTLGVAPLDSSLPCPLVRETGADLALSWTPGQPGDRVRFILASANHGSQFPAVICDVEDDGDLTVAASLLEAWWDSALPVRGWSLVRSHDGVGEVDGVDLVLSARAQEGCGW